MSEKVLYGRDLETGAIIDQRAAAGFYVIPPPEQSHAVQVPVDDPPPTDPAPLDDPPPVDPDAPA